MSKNAQFAYRPMVGSSLASSSPPMSSYAPSPMGSNFKVDQCIDEQEANKTKIFIWMQDERYKKMNEVEEKDEQSDISCTFRILLMVLFLVGFGFALFFAYQHNLRYNMRYSNVNRTLETTAFDDLAEFTE